MDSFPSRLLLNVILILIIALLRLAQVSVDSVSEARLNKLADSGDKKAKKALKVFDKSSRVYNCFRILIVLFELITAGVNAIWVYTTTIGNNTLLEYQLFVIIGFVLLLECILVFFGISLPQKIAMSNPEKIIFSSLGLINLVYYIALPFERLFSVLSSLILRLFGITNSGDDEEEVTEEDIRFMVDVGSESGAIDPDEKEMIHNIFELDDTPVGDIMTHRTEVVFLWNDENIDVWENTINSTNHSIYPVCGETVDDIIGIIKATDFYKFLRNCDNSESSGLHDIIKNAYLVPESIKADDLFRQMQLSRNHFAIVLDEYGGLGGIITMSDLLEEIVGDLDNDTESYEEDIIQLDSNTWKILGSTEIESVSKELDIDLPIEEFNTFAGMILSELGEIPDDGTTAEVEAYGLQIKVTSISEHRIEETIVCKTEQEQTEDE